MNPWEYLEINRPRKLSKVKALSSHLLSQLSHAGFHDAAALLSRSPLELLSLLHCSGEDARALLLHASLHFAPKPRNVAEMLQQHLRSPASRYLSTGLQPLDRLLRGGLPPRGITELLAPSGVGKTRFCVSIVVETLLADPTLDSDPSKDEGEHSLESALTPTLSSDAPSGALPLEPPLSTLPELGSVLYICHADDHAVASGVLELLRFKRPSLSAAQCESLCRRLFVRQVDTGGELVRLLNSIEETLVEQNIVFICIDGLDKIVNREELHASDYSRHSSKKIASLVEIASTLKYLSEICLVPVLCTTDAKHDPSIQIPSTTTTFNLSSSSSSSSSSTSSSSKKPMSGLGVVWSHAVNLRLVLEVPHDVVDSKIQHQRLTVAKSPSCPVVFLYVYFDETGIHPSHDRVTLYSTMTNFWT